MKHPSRVLALASLVLLAVLAFSPTVAGQGAFSGYTSGIQVQNLESTQADVTLTFYNPDGTVATTLNDQISANGSKTYFGTTLPVSQGFSGSVVISSSKQVAAISNMLSSDFKAGASYVGSSQGATTINLPLLMKGNSGFNSWFNVQNAGTSTANITIAYSDGTNASASIPVGAAKTFYQAQENHTAAVFSAVVTSDQPIVAVVVQEDSKTMFAYSGFTSGSTNPVMPLINANNSGFITGVQIQNAGTQDTDVTVTYTPDLAGTACTETRTIPAGKSETFALVAFNSNNSGTTTTCQGGSTFIGSAQVTTNSANQPLAVIVNQLNPGKQGESYGGFDPNAATNKVVMPLIMDRNSNYFTGIAVMNVGSSATDINCTFTGTSYTVSKTNVASGKSLTDLQANKIADGYVGSATCTASDTNAKLVGIVNELRSGSTVDEFLVYEAFNP